MRTETIKILSFDELSQEAQQTAINNHEPTTDYIYTDAENTVQEFCKAFNVETGRNSWLTYGSYKDIEYNDIEGGLKGFRLRKYIINNFNHILHKGKYYGKLTDTHADGTKIEVSKAHPIGKRHIKRYSKVMFERCCNLTGVCYDIDILKPLYNFIDDPNDTDTLNDLFYFCFDNLKNSIENEIEYRQSDEGKKEDLQAQDFEYTEDGEIYN